MLRGADGRLALRRARLHPASVWGMHLAHLGIAMFVAGVTLVNSYTIDREQRIEPGETIVLVDYSLRFIGLENVTGPNWDAVRGTFELRRAGSDKPIAVLRPDKRVYRAMGQAMTEASINRGFTRDVYVSMGESVGGDAWIVRAHVKPFVNWIWLGCTLMALGGFVSVSDRRYRRRVTARESAATASGQAA
jgi:cytochrome c-type biogenesis protein CcmF